MHRDLKCSNILITSDNVLKLCDFGLARKIAREMTTSVITLWYRPPELLLAYGKTPEHRLARYGKAVDMWSVGCIIAEILICQALFPGSKEMEQLHKIFQICGSPNRENWPRFDEYNKQSGVSFKGKHPNKLRSMLKKFYNQNFDGNLETAFPGARV